MKVLVINGSPSGEKSNTMHLTRAFLEGAKWTDAEVIDISKINVKGCTGCFSCWTKTPGKCIINDDVAKYLPKIVEADVIIWSFPLYSCGFPGELKCFMDRQLPLGLPDMDTSSETGSHPTRYDFSKKRAFYISTCGFWTAQKNYDSIIKVLEHTGGNHEKFSIFCGQGAIFNEPDAKEVADEYLKIVRRAGEECITGDISEETQKALREPMFPKEVYEGFANASW